jgi:hypothetical protein
MITRLQYLLQLGRSNLAKGAHSSQAGSLANEAAAIRRSGLFDSLWYLERNPEAACFSDPVAHYLAVGASAGLAPHPLFHVDWYRDRNPGSDRSGLTPLGHFILLGESAGASPSPLFDPAWYRQQHPSLAGQRTGLFLHFLRHGARQDLSPHPAFDPAYYRSVSVDIADGETNPLTHFMEIGAAKGLPPNPFFDTTWYAAGTGDAATSDTNSLVHFLLVGAAEGRSPHPDIDLNAYRAAHPDCPPDPLGSYRYLLLHETPDAFFAIGQGRRRAEIHQRLVQAGLFQPASYLELNRDLAPETTNADAHFIKHGLPQGRRFTTPAAVARLLATIHPQIETARAAYHGSAVHALAHNEANLLATWFQTKDARIGVFCSTEGNFYMQEIAELLAWGLEALGIRAVLRDEKARRDEPFDLRIFVAPHEFFILGRGRAWQDAAGAPNAVLYNVEQVQTQWFCRTFQTLMKAPLLLDINFQSAEILRHIGSNVVHFMPGHLASSPYTAPQEDVSDIDLARGYAFSRQRLNWMERDSINDRPIDILFVGSSSPRRDTALTRLLDLTDDYRFLCVYRSVDAPLTAHEHRATSGRINCALAQRAKIVLNIHRDWVGYFEWSRIVLQGFWQGACVVSDPNLPNPIYQPGVHFQEDSLRHLGELIRWLLSTPDGRASLDTTRRAGFAQARGLGSMPVALTPVLGAFKNLLVQ